MVATLWLISLLTITLITASECVYAPPPLVKYRRIDNTPYGFQDDFMLEKRTKPSLSIVNPLDVLRQRLLLEIARRQMRENTKQVERNRLILKNVGKRSSGDERPNRLERERYEPYQQHADLNAILNRIVDGATQSNDHSIYNLQTPDYIFDDTNSIDAKQMLPSRFQSLRTLAHHDVDVADPFASIDDSAQAWHDEKQQSLQQQKQRQPSSGQKAHYLQQWNQQISEKTNPAQHQMPQQQQQQQQQQQLKSFDNNGDFIQSYELN